MDATLNFVNLAEQEGTFGRFPFENKRVISFQ